MCFWCHFVSVGCHCFWHVFPLPISQKQVAAWFLSSYWTWQGLGDCGGVVKKAHWWSQRCGGHAHPLPHWQQHLRFHVNMSTAVSALTTPLHLTSVEIRQGRSKFGRVGPSRSRRQVILSGDGVVVSRSSHGVLFWPGVCWRLLSHPPHLSAFFLLRVKQWQRSGAVYEAITLRNACIYMRPEGPRDGFVLSAGLGFFPLTFKCQKGGSVVKLHLFDVE